MTHSPAPGWYPDSNGSSRYWDGVAWTKHTAAAPHAAPVAAYAPATAPQYAAQSNAVAPYVPAATQIAHSDPNLAYQQHLAYMAATRITVSPPRTGDSNGLATAGFILGLVSFVFMPIVLIPFLGLLFYGALSITGLVLSIMGIVRSNVTGTGLGLAIAGLVLSVL
ncbi:DUF2510 domain-containing protein [Leucobacter insecticola]|uniref:DUF2510 domain-containing protein n=1 Tax=Leucobacter insecticola TaxID=2714934 RepID=A0A6G8FIF1_9MICO|nr:DUF2510 domain-containing protein [Leucobacter insecticola]QIM16145.1 DUF2510 domain-containing protein [Leucobacter insecticola]